MYKGFQNGSPRVGRRDAVRLTLPEYDRVGGEQGYAGTGKTAMLNRALRLAVSVRDAGGGRRQGPAHLRRAGDRRLARRLGVGGGPVSNNREYPGQAVVWLKIT